MAPKTVMMHSELIIYQQQAGYEGTGIKQVTKVKKVASRAAIAVFAQRPIGDG